MGPAIPTEESGYIVYEADPSSAKCSCGRPIRKDGLCMDCYNKLYVNTKPIVGSSRIARNKPCSCGSGLKHKKCCGVVPNRTVSNMERIRSAFSGTYFTKRQIKEAAENMSDEQLAEPMEVYGELV